MNDSGDRVSQVSFHMRNYEPSHGGNSGVFVSMVAHATVAIAVAGRSIWYRPTSNWSMLIVAKIAHIKLSGPWQLMTEIERKPVLARFSVADGHKECVGE